MTINGTTGQIYLSSASTSTGDVKIKAKFNDLSVSTTFTVTFISALHVSPVTKLSLGKNINYQFVVGIPATIPFSFDKGTPKNCVSNPSLPAGLTITTAHISGTPTGAVVLKAYEISCSNDDSVTNAVKLISSVVAEPTPGLLGTYSKFPNTLIECTKSYTAFSPGSVINFQKMETSISHPYSDADASWSELNNDFTESYVTTWRGYLKVEANQENYKIIVESDEGAWVTLDNQKLIDNVECNSMMNKTGVKSVTAGLHPIEINYFQISGGKGFKIYHQIGSSEIVEIPFNLFFYIPQSPIIYKFTHASYLVNRLIIENSPIQNGLTVSLYSIEPQLVDGLTIHPGTGVISGTPTKHTNNMFQTYTIFIETSVGMLTTTVTFKISGGEAPYSIKLKIYGGRTISSYEDLTLYRTSSIVVISTVYGGGISRSLTPSLPSGLNFNLQNGEISGRCNNFFSELFTLSVTNLYGRAVRSFRFTCSNMCPVGLEPLGIKMIFHSQVQSINFVLSSTYNNIIKQRSNPNELTIGLPSVRTDSWYYKCVSGTDLSYSITPVGYFLFFI